MTWGNAADPKWVRVAGPPVEILSNAPPKEVQAAAADLARTYHAYSRLLVPISKPAVAVRAILFRSESDFAPFRMGSFLRGFYQSSAERDYVVLPLTGYQKSRVLRHELTHLFLNHNSGPMPIWLEEGTAEFFSTVEVVDGRARVGRVIESHVRLLNSGRGWLPLERLVVTGKDSAEYNSEHQAGVLYAESWALVHMLQHGPAYRGRMQELTGALSAGLSHEAAFQRAYGKGLREVEAELRSYIESSRFPVREIAVPAMGEAGFKVESMEVTDVYVALAELQTAQGRAEAAAEWYERIRQELPDSAGRDEALGFLALQRNQLAEAEQHWTAALRRGSRHAGIAFELAMLKRDGRRPDEELAPLLRQAVEWNPAFAEAWLQLGALEFRQGRVEPAIDAFRNAVRVLPRQSSFWVALARAYRANGRRESAENAAQRAMEAAVSEDERKVAESVMREPVDAGEAERAGKSGPDVVVPRSWDGLKGDEKIEGRLIEVSCAAKQLVFHIRTGDRTIALAASEPNRVRVNGATAPTEFPCGPQKGQVVRAEFVSATQQLVAIEYR